MPCRELGPRSQRSILLCNNRVNTPVRTRTLSAVVLFIGCQRAHNNNSWCPVQNKVNTNPIYEKSTGWSRAELEYDELEIYEVLSRSTSLISTCGKTVMHLKLGPHDGKFHTLHNTVTSIAQHITRIHQRALSTHSKTSNLRELAFTSSLLPPEEISLMSTIASTNIQKIALRPFLQRDLSYQFWSSLDTELSGLVDRLCVSGYQHALGLVLQHNAGFAVTVTNTGPSEFFPSFMSRSS